MFGNFARLFTLCAALIGAATFASDARAQIRTANGVAYYDVDPGPIDPGSFWTGGQYKYDPNAYMDRTRWDAGRPMVVYAPHAGKTNCVFRQRVIFDDWDFRHPYVQVCRRPQ